MLERPSHFVEVDMPASLCLLPRHHRASSHLAALGLSLCGLAQAAQLGSRTVVGLTGMADVPPPVLSGSAWQDGVPQSIPLWPSAYALDVELLGSYTLNSQLALAVAVPPAPGAPPLPLPAQASTSADVGSGHLGLAGSSSAALITEADAAQRSAFTVFSTSVEMGDVLELRMPYAGGTPTPLTVQLQLSLSGSLLDLPNDSTLGLLSTLRLNNVLATPGGYASGQQRLDSFTHSLSGQTLSLSGQLIDPACSLSLNVCAYWFGAYAALEATGSTLLGDKTVGAPGAGDSLDFNSAGLGGQLHLLVPAGASVVSVASGQGYGWISAVPEPGSAALALLGITALAGRLRRPFRA
ncbi:hypothetical protein RQP53_12930 [Paucibacter sp. APW11]|uniref:PEP-CTERM protein-sorting domain-containing protein n=1 Tax=Roseateles aquae TaxID=3077235 RepID=A0ABU3PC73_9BURK|nr:hypothetical protein [Paucibacter sp. APW11]MDT9000174.1 hypothetical protein [Paucibacter sp. APW11]